MVLLLWETNGINIVNGRRKVEAKTMIITLLVLNSSLIFQNGSRPFQMIQYGP